MHACVLRIFLVFFKKKTILVQTTSLDNKRSFSPLSSTEKKDLSLFTMDTWFVIRDDSVNIEQQTVRVCVCLNQRYPWAVRHHYLSFTWACGGGGDSNVFLHFLRLNVWELLIFFLAWISKKNHNIRVRVSLRVKEKRKPKRKKIIFTGRIDFML